MSALAAAGEWLPLDQQTTGEILAWARARLRRAGIDDPRLDARLLLMHATGWPLAALIAQHERALDAAAMSRFRAAVERRAAREPVSRIVGRRGFWRHEFLVGPGALDPRPDSEVLVEQALARLAPDAGGLTVDLGVGSGCLLLSVLAERPAMRGLGVDLSAAALEVAVANAAQLGLSDRCGFVRGDWADALRGQVADCVMVNPPYVRRKVVAELAEEVRCFDPRLALDGDEDGLAAYRRLAPQLAALLRGTGVAVIEIGHDQARDVTSLLVERGMVVTAPGKDLGGRDRCLIATAAAS